MYSSNDAVAIRLLAEHGANINVRTVVPARGIHKLTSASTPLHLAAMFCCPAAVTALLELGADAELRTMNDETPLLSGERTERVGIMDLYYGWASVAVCLLGTPPLQSVC